MTDTLFAAAQAAPPLTLLCVDDEPNILSSLRRLFRAKGYRVLTAEGGAAGLAVLETETVDLVISDMRMPEMDGAQFLAQVRQRWPDVIRLLLTGYSDIQSILDAINCGEIYRYITKPWDDNDIALVVRHALERRVLEQEKLRLERLTQQQNEALRMLNLSLEAKVEARTVQLKKTTDEVLLANEKLKSNFVTTIKLFSSIIEMRGGSLNGHSRRTADLARRIGVQMGVPAKEIQEIFIAALLLDIGKIGFSDELLETPLTMMTGDTLGLFRKHPVRAEQLLMALEDLRGAATILRSQMERFDGAGFPDALAGLAIPLGARILALASDYDNLQIGAMVQRQLRADEAKQLIYDSSGKRYDPLVVAAFRQLIDGNGADAGVGDVAALSGELVPGMKLSRDLVSRDGLMLLAADHVLDARLIQQVQDFEAKSGGRLTIRVFQPKEA
ncbi:HD domain-containing phosphohydrolase [Janthinobacterium sp.]|uniref:HD domain-containing phosphohydrolase n=1 Tax=Janthinobacterium sp. TaxID=1871054 RepID=UPI00293D3D8A|nr:HD domain-containing phosphohydrolase [Janthinobacterium sp.]